MNVFSSGRELGPGMAGDAPVGIPRWMVRGGRAVPGECLAAFVALAAMACSSPLGEVCADAAQAWFWLAGDMPSRGGRLGRRLREGLEEAVSGPLAGRARMEGGHAVADREALLGGLRGPDGEFRVWLGEARAAFALGGDPFSLLRYFAAMMSTVGEGAYARRAGLAAGCEPVSSLAGAAGVSESSALSYNARLEGAGLAYFRRLGGGRGARPRNFYGRPAARADVDALCEAWARGDAEGAGDANERRRMAQMYRHIQRGGGCEYSDAEVAAVRDYVLAENARYMALYRAGDAGALSKIRDARVFGRLGFPDG